MADGEIILAFSQEAVTAKLVKMLNASGIRVAGVCRSASEAMRLSADMNRVLIITSFKMPDMTAEEMYSMLPRGSEMIVIGKGQQRDMIANDDIIFLPLPVHKDDLSRAVHMAFGGYSIQSKKPPRPVRTEKEKQIIAEAKHFLMERYMMSEMQAHRFIQKQSMDNGLKFIDMARRVLAQEN